MNFKKRKKNSEGTDENFDKDNYDNTARIEMSLPLNKLKQQSGISQMNNLFKPPFELYYELIRRNIENRMVVLELGSGTGRHTGQLIATGASIMALDISEESLKVAKLKYPKIKEIIPANMNCIPLPDNSVDAVVSCGSLSYSDPEKTNQEIIRVMRNGGILIALDSLNHNPVYRLNKFARYLVNRRSKSSIERIPSLARIRSLENHFSSSQAYFFGSYLWLLLPIQKVFGKTLAFKLNNFLERVLPSSKYAFKFVLICKGRK